MGLKDRDLFQGEAPTRGLGSWHANLVYIDRRKCLILANDKTLVNFIVPEVKRTEIRELHRLFHHHLRRMLTREGVSEVERESLAAEYSEIEYAKSTDKSVLGSMNNLAFHYKCRIMDAGGIHSVMIPGIIHSLNNMPMAALDYAFPSEALRQHLKTEKSGNGA